LTCTRENDIVFDSAPAAAAAPVNLGVAGMRSTLCALSWVMNEVNTLSLFLSLLDSMT